MSDVDVIIKVHTQGVQEIGNLSASLRNLNNTLRGISVPMSKLDVQSRAVNKALGVTSRGVDQHAKSIKQLVSNQKVLGAEARRVKNDLVALKNAYALAGKETTALGRSIGITTKEMQGFSRVFRGMRIRAFGSDISNISLRLSKLGKDAQFVGRSLLINLSLPIAAFARTGLQNFIKINKEMTRLTKVLEDIAPTADVAAQKITGLKDANASMLSAEQEDRAEMMVKNYNDLNKAVTDLSLNFGVAKDLVASIGADFAELGLTSKENVIQLTDLTLQIEKLGGMDIGPAQALSQALFFQSKRALEVNKAFKDVTEAREREKMAIRSSIVQLQLFNAIENATALTLRDLGDAFPEVASMATSFGLSMTEAAALLAPMKAAGLDVGASANSIKVSLQRALAPTKQNADMLQKLAVRYGVASDKQNEFALSSKSGLIGLESIVKVFDKVRQSSAGMEGALKLMSDMFEKRQGPRMYLAIEQLADFNRELAKVDDHMGELPNKSQTAEVQLARVAERAAMSFKNFNTTAVPTTIRSFKDIGNIARIATAFKGQEIEFEPGKATVISQQDIDNARLIRKEVSKYIIDLKQAEGIDVISEVKTEAGRAIMIQLAGSANAAAVAQAELDRSLATTGVQVDRIKNAFKLFAADIIQRLTPAIEKLAKRVVEMYEKWMSPEFEKTRERIVQLIITLGTFLATMGPIILGIGTFNSVIGNVGRGLSGIFPKLKNVQGEFIGIGRTAKLAGDSINSFYKRFLTKAKVPDVTDMLSPKTGAALTDADVFSRAMKLPKADVDRAMAEFAKGARFKTKGPTFGAPLKSGNLPILQGNTLRAMEILTAQEMAGKTKFLKTGTMSTPAGFVSPTSRFGETLKGIIREPSMAKAGISQDFSGSQIKFFRKGREIAEKQALMIGRGGAVGALGKVQVAGMAAKEGVGRVVSSARGVVGGARMAAGAAGAAPGVSGFGKAIASSKAFSTSILTHIPAFKAAQAAQAQYIMQTKAMNGVPGRFKTISAGIMGFAKSFKIATFAARIFRMALLFTGVGAIIAGIAAVVFLVIKNLDKIRGATKAWDALKAAFNLVKEAVMEIVRPIQDLFASFGSGADEGAKAGDGIAKAFTGIAEAVKFVAGLFKLFVEKVIQPYLYGVVNIVMAVVALFKGNWQDALKFLIAAFASVIKGIVNLFAMMAKGLVSIIVKLVNSILGIFAKIPGMGGMIKGIQGAVTKVGNGINGLFDKVAGGIGGLLDKGVALGIKKSTNTITNSKPKIVPPAKDLGYEGGEAMGNSFGDGFDDADPAEKMKNSIKEGITDAVQKLQDYVAGRLANALKKFATESAKALNKQKESALKVFDVQLNTLMKLEKAEESLTRKKQYETNRRKIIDDAALRQENYRRDRALAIYEGRIDDARILDLEERRAQRGTEEEITTIDDERRKELAKENLDALREAISQAKELAGKFFDESIEKFQDAAENITRIAPVTIEQYTQQLEELKALTTQYSDNNNAEFGNMFQKFSTTISEKMPNTIDDFGKALGGFTTPLNELVSLAQNKFGLGSEWDNTVLGVTSKMADSVTGITLGMLVDLGDTFVGEPGNSVITKYGEFTGGVVGETQQFKTDVMDIFKSILQETKDSFINPYKKAFDDADPTKVFNEAIVDGNEEIKRSFENMVQYNKELFEKMKGYLDPAINKWVELKAAIDAANDAASSSPGGGPGGPGDGTSFGDGFERAEWNRFMRIRAGIDPNSPVFRRDISGRTGFATGGYLNAPTSQAIPAILHGGEFVIRAAAVKKIGISTLMRLNNYKVPGFKMGGPIGINSTFRAPVSNLTGVSAPVINNVSTVNIQVENFIGEEEWFNSMMKEYNINVAPKNQKLAGLENRRFTSYNGINQGM